MVTKVENIMLISQKTEIFPNNEQKEILAQCFGVRRFVFNKGLMILKQKYGSNFKSRVKEIKKKELTEIRNLIRDEYNHITITVPSQICGTAIEDLARAIDSLKFKGKEITLRKKKAENTFRIERKSGSTFFTKPNSDIIRIVKLGDLKMAEPLRFLFKDNIKTTTIKYKAGRYFLTICVDIDGSEIKTYEKTGKRLALDWGIKTFFTGYDGSDFFEIDFNRRTMELLDQNIRAKARRLSNRRIYSKNWYQAKIKLEQAYLNRVNYQEDFLFKTANEIVQLYDEVILEDLNMSFVYKNHKLAKKASEKMYYKFKVICANKLAQSNKRVLLVDRSFPSTQTCSCCGHRLEKSEKMKLSDRIFKCPTCRMKMDRDENAAKNIYNCSELKEF